MNLTPILLLLLSNTFCVVSSFRSVGFPNGASDIRSHRHVMNEKTARRTLYDAQDSLPKTAGQAIGRTVGFFRDRTVGEEVIKNSPQFSKQPIEKNKRVILALDGGGVRGLMTTYVLQVLEDEINRQAERTDSNRVKIGEVFDVVAGTSTGALLATYLTSYSLHEPRTIQMDDGSEITLDGSAKGATEMYKAFAKKIFPQPQKPEGVLQHTKSAAKRVWSFLPLTTIAGKIWEGLTHRSLHSDDGINEALLRAFPPEMTLNWLAEKKGKMIGSDESRVASLFVVSYDMVFRRPVAFYADRDFHRARFLTADTFLEPHLNPVSLRSKVGKRREAMRNALNRYKEENQGCGFFTEANLGDADVALHEDQIVSNHPRYSRAFTKEIPISLGQVCRCSVAAPVFLPPGYVKDFYVNDDGSPLALVCCDGGVVANAPAQACFNAVYYATCAEFLKDNMTFSPDRFRGSNSVNVEDFASQMVLSIGCGQLGKESHADAVKDVKIRDYLNPKSDIGNLIEVLMSTGAQISHVNLETLFATEKQLDHYLRIQLSANMRGEPGGITNSTVIDALSVLDNSSDEAIDVYERIGKMLAEVYEHDMKEFVEEMLRPGY